MQSSKSYPHFLIVNSAIIYKIITAINNITPKIADINSFSENINKQKNSIIDKVEQTSAIAEEVSASSEEIAASSQQMNSASLEVAKSAETLTNMSKEVLCEIEKFNL